MKIGVILSRVRVEEKWLFEALDKRGLDYDRLDDREIKFNFCCAGRVEEIRRGAGAQLVIWTRTVCLQSAELAWSADGEHGNGG